MRRRVNTINSQVVDEVEITEPIEIEKHVIEFYETLYGEDYLAKPKVDGVEVAHLSENQDLDMERPITEDEVCFAIRDLRRDIVVGLDGFPMAVLNRCWSTFKEDIMFLVKEFEVTGFLDWRLKYG
ncbi:hypothetical protein FRX31_018837 [Thalictrum thalictroides]|uniref:Uncharacterized protein n=1 Tax=Thalictrum thalictroides TaxID=46969 RepID=A0A7J6W3P6_THATH|nr:hypothetical protein FRX31_018837 [Thalictrum thalictroides]